MTVTFDTLPQAVEQLYNKLDSIEKLLTQQQQVQADELMTIDEIKDALGVSYRTVQNWIAKHRIQADKVKRGNCKQYKLSQFKNVK